MKKLAEHEAAAAQRLTQINVAIEARQRVLDARQAVLDGLNERIAEIKRLTA